MTPFLLSLPHALVETLAPQAERFTKRWEFIGCAGFEVTEQIRYAMGYYGALLTLRRPHALDHIRTVYLYPEPFLVERIQDHGGFVTHEEGTLLTGEASTRGGVVLSWQDMMTEEPGYSVALHELAHQLDWEDSEITGTPTLPCAADYLRWKQIFERAYNRLLNDEEEGLIGPMDPYALENEGEFFAVAVETFFTDPESLEAWDPLLYDELKHYFGIDF